MKVEIFENRERSIEGVVLRDHADVAPCGRRPGNHVHSRDRHLAAGRQGARGGNADGGCFSRPIRPQQAEDLALLDGKVDAIYGNDPLLSFIDFC